METTYLHKSDGLVHLLHGLVVFSGQPNVCHFKMVYIDAIRPHTGADQQILQLETFKPEAIIS